MIKMKYQVSLEGHIKGKHVQIAFYNTDDYRSALHEAYTRDHLPHDSAEEYVALLFRDRSQALRDGIPPKKIEKLDDYLYRYIVQRTEK